MEMTNGTTLERYKIEELRAAAAESDLKPQRVYLRQTLHRRESGDAVEVNVQGWFEWHYGQNIDATITGDDRANIESLVSVARTFLDAQPDQSVR